MFPFAPHHQSAQYAGITGRAEVVEPARTLQRKDPPMKPLAIAACFAASAQCADLPDALKQAGAFRLPFNATYALMECHDPATNELNGLDVDLAEAIAKKLGVGITWTDVPFEPLIPGLAIGRSDFIISGFSDRASRRDTMDSVDHLGTGPQFFTLEGSTARAPADLCGMKVGTVRSTSFTVGIEKWGKANCEASGKPAI